MQCKYRGDQRPSGAGGGNARLAALVLLCLLLPFAKDAAALSPEREEEIAGLEDAAAIAAYQAGVTKHFADPLDQGSAYRLLALRWERLNETERALDAHNLSVLALETLPDSAELVYSLGERSYAVYVLTGDRAQYCPDREQALAVARRLGQPEPLVFALIRRAFCFGELDNFQTGLADLQEAMAIATENQLEDNAKQMVANASGQIYRSVGLHDRAYTAFRQAYDLWREAGDVADYFNMLHSLVGEAVEVGRWDDALEHVEAMFAVAARHPDNNAYLFFAHFNRGRLALAQSDYELADLAFSEALALKSTTAEQHYVSRAYLRRAEARVWLGRYDEAWADLKTHQNRRAKTGESAVLLDRLIPALTSGDAQKVTAVMLELRQRERQKRYAFVDANTRRSTREHEDRIAQYESNLLKQQLALKELELERAADRSRLDRQGRTIFALVATLLLALAIWLYHSRRRHRERARTDYLTGIASRGSVFEKGFKLRDRAARRGQSLAVVLFDIDHFKRINDRYGHGVGDQAIRQTVLAVKDTLRSGELIGRLGGEEFIVVLPGSDLPAALTHAEVMRAAVERAGFLHAGQHQVDFTISLGVAVLESGDNFQSLVNRADQALYMAKHSGRNRVTAAPEERAPLDPESVGAGSRQEPRAHPASPG